jgi:hypothetical protein
MNITNNTIRNWNSNFGMDVSAGAGASPTLNFTVTGNLLNLNSPGANNLHGIHFNLGTTSAGVVTACVDVGGAGALLNNPVGSSNGGSEIRVRQRNSSVVRMPGFAGGAADPVVYLTGRNTVTGGLVTTAGTFSGGAACTQAP